MSQKQNLQRSPVRYFIKLSAITSGIILVFSIGLGIVTKNLERPKSEQVLGSTELLNSDNTLPETDIGDPSQPSQNPQNPDFVNNPKPFTSLSRDTAIGGNPISGTNGTQPVFESDTVICYEKISSDKIQKTADKTPYEIQQIQKIQQIQIAPLLFASLRILLNNPLLLTTAIS